MCVCDFHWFLVFCFFFLFHVTASRRLVRFDVLSCEETIHAAIMSCNLFDEWLVVLREAFDEELAQSYATCMSKAFVDVSDAPGLPSSEYAEIGIAVGHRKKVREAAGKCNRLNQRLLGSPPNTAQAESFTAEKSHEPTSSSIVAELSAKPPGLSVVHRRSSTHHSITWVDVTGSSPTLKEFFAGIGDIMNAVGLRDATWMMSGFQDNKPMPFAKLTDPSLPGKLAVLRIPDLSNTNGSKLAEITNRVVVWWPTMDESVVLTYHRCEKNPLEWLADNFDTARFANMTQGRFFNAVVQAVVKTYRDGLKALQSRSDEFEDVAGRDVVKMIAGMTNVQKQVAVYARCLAATRDVFDEIANSSTEEADSASDEIARDCANHKIGIESLVTLANELNENASSSINMQMALDGFRAGVNMKLFTYVSVLTQPITVATGWYGMNFDNMPDLLYEDAYFVFIGIICGVVVVLMGFLAYRSFFAAL